MTFDRIRKQLPGICRTLCMVGALTAALRDGIAIANACISANDGKMTALSEGPGQGTMVAIELPVAQDAVPQMESDADE